ncbi:hypothetical protein [Methylotenera sp.]|uniref:DUF7482 domain-containing protein n=1 Tax=Methylotenera sp. TaxID=2051956 RepID=UPI0024886C3B|nr:hypothetical protein [Methylotenera sp.]MDI1299702.1 hypothetical protein [Methylotenera sp.]
MGRTVSILVILIGLLSGCASTSPNIGKSETVIPVSRAWVDGRVVEYITTDISDADMAKMLGVNHVPRLAEAASAQPGHSLLERVYKFPNNEQMGIFQSAPSPAGGENQDLHYSPLWRVVLVRWKAPQFVREIKSEAGLFEAEERQELSLEVTNIVVNCPITRDSNGQTLKGVR